MKSFHCISGLPRSGSSLLANLLNMQKNHFVTPTSPTLEMLKIMRSNFSHDITWKAMNRMEVYDNFRNGLKGFIKGYFADKDIVFDKNRAWPGNIELLDEILGNKDSKIIWCYRDPVDVIGSIESQYQRSLLIESMDEQNGSGAFLTLDRRIGAFMNDGGMISYSIEILRNALEMGYGNRILIVRYYDLTNNTQDVLDGIHDFIGEPRQVYDLSKLKQSTYEFDGMYNYKFLHTIKEGGVTYKKSDVELPTKYVNIIKNKFAGLNKFVFEGNPDLLLGITEEELRTQQLTIKLK